MAPEGRRIGPAAATMGAVHPPALRRLSAVAWYWAFAAALPVVVALADGVIAGQAMHAMLPDLLATLVTLAVPLWPLTLFAGSIALRRSEPKLAPSDARYPGSRHLGSILVAIGVVGSIIEVACFEFWPGRQDPRWFGSVAGMCAAFAGLGVLAALAVRYKEHRMALGLWTDPRAVWERLGEGGGSAHPAVAVYYGQGPDAPINA
jgi:hypothetical protein